MRHETVSLTKQPVGEDFGNEQDLLQGVPYEVISFKNSDTERILILSYVLTSRRCRSPELSEI